MLTQFRQVMKVPDNFRVLLTQGGASQQFSAIPLNLAGDTFGTEEAVANFMVSGTWSKAAFNEAKKYLRPNQVNNQGSNPKEVCESVLDLDSWKFDKKAKYFCFC